MTVQLMNHMSILLPKSFLEIRRSLDYIQLVLTFLFLRVFVLVVSLLHLDYTLLVAQVCEAFQSVELTDEGIVFVFVVSGMQFFFVD